RIRGERLERRAAGLLPGTGGVPDHAHRGTGVAVRGDDGERLVELRGTPGAARVVEAEHEIGGRTGAQPVGDDLPRRVQVGQRQVGVVVAERGAEQGTGGERGGDARYHLDVDIRTGELQGGRGHR